MTSYEGRVRVVPLGIYRKWLKRKTKVGGADGIVSDSLKKTQEKPLNLRAYYHLLILALSVRSLREAFGPHNIARSGQQLATVIPRCPRASTLATAAQSRGEAHVANPSFKVLSFRYSDILTSGELHGSSESG